MSVHKTNTASGWETYHPVDHVCGFLEASLRPLEVEDHDTGDDNIRGSGKCVQRRGQVLHSTS